MQIFTLDSIMCNLKGLRPIKRRRLEHKIETFRGTMDDLKFRKKSEALKGKVIKEIIFDPIIDKIKNKKNNDAKRNFINKFFH